LCQTCCKNGRRTCCCRTSYSRTVGDGEVHGCSLLQAAVGAVHTIPETSQVCGHQVRVGVGLTMEVE
jgi:hypothetical protein